MPMRLRVSAKLLPGVPDGVPVLLEEPTSELFCLKWFRVGEEEDTYVFARGAICRYPIADTLLRRFLRAAKADD